MTCVRAHAKLRGHLHVLEAVMPKGVKWGRLLTKFKQGCQEIWHIHGELFCGGQEARIVARVLPVQQARRVLTIHAAAVAQS